MSTFMEGVQDFSTLLFNFSNIDTCFIDNNLNVHFDYGYNVIPIPLQDHFSNAKNLLKLNEPNSKDMVFFHTTSHKTSFITAKVYDTKDYIGSIVVGPYLVEEPTPLMIESILFKNKLSISFKHLLSQYYYSLPLITPYKAKLLAKFIACHLPTLSTFCLDTNEIETLTYEAPNHLSALSDTLMSVSDGSSNIIEKTYVLENKLMHAIEHGVMIEEDELSNDFLFFTKNVKDRIPLDTLRSRKNLSFVLNTILRKAAEKGGLDLIKIHSISEKFAIQIEKTSSILDLVELQKNMVLTYSNTTRKHSLKNYTYTARKAIEYIRINLDQDLSLDLISNALNISSYQLSREFKKETNVSITHYINAQRINEAVYCLENQAMSITDIAHMVGFNDVNYFTKVFKSFKGITPSQYKKSTNLL